MIGRRNSMIAAALVLGVAGLSTLAWHMTVEAGRGRLDRELADKLTVTGRAVASEVERFRYLPGVLAQDPRVTALIDGAGAGGLADVANRYLARVRDHAGADELYVLDAGGTTLAASNWAEETSFVGRNYRFRSYFKDALARGEGRFYAVGVTTGKPGHFLSSRIETPSGARGVAVAKVDMAPLELAWARAGERTGVADPAGVIFLTGYVPWKYRLLDPLQPAAMDAIQDARQYDGVRLATDPLLNGGRQGNAAETLVEDGESFLLRRQRLEPEGWQLFATASMEPVIEQARLAALMTAFGTLLAAAVVLYLRQRRQLVRMKLDAHDELEMRVAERTQELAREVEERKRAEAELRAAQEDLIQAAKLAALGRMSTAIVHEVSQPLAAMETTLASTALLADRGSPADVKRTVRAARDLVRRMQRTVRHLKSFARRDRGGLSPVDLRQAVDAAVELASHRARDQGIAIGVEATGNLPPVLGHSVRLEQVVLNLLVNALDAVRSVPQPEIRVTMESAGGAVTIAVSDNGGGVDEALRDRITEPFFTTKETGEGLGLGLAISRAIVEDLGGTLSFAPRPGCGSVFSVSLPVAAAEVPLVEAAE